MIILLISPGNKPMTGVTGKKPEINSSPEEFRYSCALEDSVLNAARKIEIISGGITVKDTLNVDVKKFRDDWYWFIGINLYPK